MNKENLRVAYVDAPKTQNINNNLIINILRNKFNIIFDNNTPDLLIYEPFGFNHLSYTDPLKLFFTGENVFPDFNVCDYALSHMRDNVGGRNFHLRHYHSTFRPMNNVTPDMAHRDFCSFVVYDDSSRIGSQLRIKFTQYLSEHYKHVVCPGRVLHNYDAPEFSARFSSDWNNSKRLLLSRYKFNIAFENTNTDGYITEKIVDAFYANTIPIYWGSEGNTLPFPKNAMIYANDYPDFPSLINRIRELDENDDLYLEVLRANPLLDTYFIDNQKKYRQRLEEWLYGVGYQALSRHLIGGCLERRSVTGFTLSYKIRKMAEKLGITDYNKLFE